MPKIVPGLPTTLTCPLCSWTYEIKPMSLQVDDNTLADVMGVGVYKQAVISNYAADIEAALKTHFESHTTIQWVTKIATLLKRIEELEGELASANSDNVELMRRLPEVE